jgi:hypothetical protein
MRRISRHLTYANVMATLAVFIALGGTALASVIITSNSQVAQNTISGHKPPSGKHPNIIAGSINGQDIADRSGVDTCKTPLVAKFGPICVGSDGAARNWENAVTYCAGFDLRLPTFGEAVALAKNHAVPGVSTGQDFWTDEEFLSGSTRVADIVNQDGSFGIAVESVNAQTVCVTDPSA